MRVLITGATGFVGRALALRLQRDAATVVAWVRAPERARSQLGPDVELVPSAGDTAALRRAVDGCDAVVHLAGAPVLPRRWTAARKLELRGSRIDLAAALVDAMAAAERRPRVLISASAIGFYGDRGDEPLDERASRGDGFLAELCRDWETAASRATDLGARVVLLRTGVVLGLDGGALVSMLPPFRMGTGGRLGSGRQHMPWIHVEDWVRLVLTALDDERYRGPFNATAPGPPSNREYTAALAGVLGKPAFMPVPALALRALFGGAASILLESQRAVPERLQEMGFEHVHSTLEGALQDLLVHERPSIERVSAAQLPQAPGAKGATHRLSSVTELGVPLEEAFAFFSTPDNLGLLTPKSVGFHIVERSGPPAEGATLDYRIRVGPVPMKWRSRFEAWEAPLRFADVQERGPYRVWWHEHRFEDHGATTRMLDTVFYRPPLGPLGTLANRLFISDQLGDIFRQRALAVRLRFGGSRSSLG